MIKNPPPLSRLTLKPLLLALLLLLLLAVLIKAQQTTIAQRSASASEQLFSGQRALAQLQQLMPEQRPHPVDSQANQMFRLRLVGLLRTMGYQPTTQVKRLCIERAVGMIRCTRVHNIVVHIPAGNQNSEPGILLSAHYDSVMAGPGGADDGMGIASLLEIARLLSIADQPPRNPIVLLFNDGEEFGLFGAQAFMQYHPLAKGLQVALNIEARGTGGQSVLFETGENSGWLIKHYAATTPAPLTNSLFYEVYKLMPNDTDMTIYKNYGLQGLNFANGERVQHYHTPLDNLTNLDRGTLQHHGENVWQVLKQIKDADLNQTKAGNLVYTDIVGWWVLYWDEPLSLWFAVILILLLSGALIRLKRQQCLSIHHWRKGLMAVPLIVLCGAAGALAVQLSALLLSGSSAPWHTNALPMRMAVSLAVLLLGLLAAKRLATQASVIDMAAAVTTGWCLLALLTSLLMPGISYLFMIPATNGVLGLWLSAWLMQSNMTQPSRQTLLITLLLGQVLVTGICFIPLLYLLETMLGYDAAVVIGALLSFVSCALLPLTALKTTAEDEFKKLALALSVCLLLTLGATSTQPATTPEFPHRLNLQYLQQDHDQGLILAAHGRHELPSSLTQVFPKTNNLSQPFPWSKQRFHALAVPSVQLPPARLEILDSKVTAVGKSVQLKLSASQPDLSDIKIYIPNDSGLISISADQNTLDYQGKDSVLAGYYGYHCRGQGCATMTLSIDFANTKALKIAVLSQSHGLPSTYQSVAELRASQAVPSRDGDQSIVLSWFDL